MPELAEQTKAIISRLERRFFLRGVESLDERLAQQLVEHLALEAKTKPLLSDLVSGLKEWETFYRASGDTAQADALREEIDRFLPPLPAERIARKLVENPSWRNWAFEYALSADEGTIVRAARPQTEDSRVVFSQSEAIELAKSVGGQLYAPQTRQALEATAAAHRGQRGIYMTGCSVKKGDLVDLTTGEKVNLEVLEIEFQPGFAPDGERTALYLCGSSWAAAQTSGDYVQGKKVEEIKGISRQSILEVEGYFFFFAHPREEIIAK